MESKAEDKKKTKSDVMWAQIKDLPVEIYALPDQKVSQHVERLVVAEDRVHLRVKSPAIVPALEEALGKVKLASGERYEVLPQRNFLVVSLVFDANDIIK